MHRLRFVISGLSVLFLACTALAGEGRFEINAACVASGCFANDAPGFPVELVNPGHYVLTSDLSVPDGSSGISVVSEGQVVLDLNGQQVKGAWTCSGFPTVSCTGGSISGAGLRLSGDGPVRVVNGRVSGFYVGVNCADACELDGLHIDGNEYAGIQAIADPHRDRGATLRRSTIEKNEGTGILMNGHAALIEESSFFLNGTAVSADGFPSLDEPYSKGLFRNNIVMRNQNPSKLSQMFVTGNAFDEDFNGGSSFNDNNCNAAIC